MDSLKQRRNISIRAVDQNEGFLGFLRLSASRRNQQFREILGNFTLDSDFKVLTAPSLEDLFFYGDESILRDNFRKPKYGPQQKGEKVRVNIQDLNLSTEKEDFIREVLDYFIIEGKKFNLERKTISSEKNSQSYRVVVTQLKDFIPEILPLVLENGSYLRYCDQVTLSYNPTPPISKLDNSGIKPRAFYTRIRTVRP